MRMIFDQNSVLSKFVKGGGEGLKFVKIVQFSDNRRTIRSRIAYPKISPLGHLEGNICVFFPFMTFKKSCSSLYLPTKLS